MSGRSWLADAIGTVATDVRQRLVEEGWFGRIVTPRPLAGSDRAAEHGSFADRLGWERPAGRDGPDHGIDH